MGAQVFKYTSVKTEYTSVMYVYTTIWIHEYLETRVEYLSVKYLVRCLKKGNYKMYRRSCSLNT